MSKKSSIECELIFEEGLHRVNFDGNLQELSFISVLIINTLRSEYIDAGFTDEQTKGLLVGGIEKFWGDPNAGGRSEKDENLSNERYANKLAQKFIKDNLLAMIVVQHMETDIYRIYVYRSQKQILLTAGRLNKLNSALEEINEEYLDAAVLELRLVTGNLNIPIRVVA